MTDVFVQHCITVYNALQERATEKEGRIVFVGKLGDVYNTVGISRSYYTGIFQTLEDVGAIKKVQKGSRSVDSILILEGLPEVWPAGLGWKGKNSRPLTEDTRYGTILLEVEKLKESTGGMNIVSVLMDFEQRIEALERAAGIPVPRK